MRCVAFAQQAWKWNRNLKPARKMWDKAKTYTVIELCYAMRTQFLSVECSMHANDTASHIQTTCIPYQWAHRIGAHHHNHTREISQKSEKELLFWILNSEWKEKVYLPSTNGRANRREGNRLTLAALAPDASKRNSANMKRNQKNDNIFARQLSSRWFAYFYAYNFCVCSSSRLQQMQSQRLRRFPFQYRFVSFSLLEWHRDVRGSLSVVSHAICHYFLCILPVPVCTKMNILLSLRITYLSSSCIEMDRNLFQRSTHSKKSDKRATICQNPHMPWYERIEQREEEEEKNAHRTWFNLIIGWNRKSKTENKMWKGRHVSNDELKSKKHQFGCIYLMGARLLCFNLFTRSVHAICAFASIKLNSHIIDHLVVFHHFGIRRCWPRNCERVRKTISCTAHITQHTHTHIDM